MRVYSRKDRPSWGMYQLKDRAKTHIGTVWARCMTPASTKSCILIHRLLIYILSRQVRYSDSSEGMNSNLTSKLGSWIFIWKQPNHKVKKGHSLRSQHDRRRVFLSYISQYILETYSHTLWSFQSLRAGLYVSPKSSGKHNDCLIHTIWKAIFQNHILTHKISHPERRPF